ncbi:MAG TPA: hypothetical protein VHP56_13395 [Solirubrobacterales bacterium]|jgi:hypothetical protein|nr:hypothetical protein [Solirubrobacterales bacterium]
MKKKSIISVVGALVALAFTALPSMASAEETALRCLTGPPCTFTLHGGITKLSAIGGDTMTCSAVAGSGQATPLTNNEATTGNVELTLTGCAEANSGFKFKCNSPGQVAGTITANTLVTHNVKLPAATASNEAGVLYTGTNVTYSCAGGLAIQTLTGNLIGENENKCGPGSRSATQKLNFLAETVAGVVQDGKQKIREWTSVKYDLEDKTNHAGAGSYETFAIESTWTATFNQEVELTCAK